MVEAINWTAFRNQGVYGMPPPFELSRIPEMAKNIWSHPFAQKIRDGLSQAASAWWENVNPTKIKDKDMAWRIGLAVGLVESAAFTFILPGSGMVKGGVNFAATQGAFIGARQLNINAEPHIRSFFKGVSAGGAYFSLPLGALNEISSGVGQEGQLPDITQAPGAARDRVGELFSGLGTIVHNVTGLGLEGTPAPTGDLEAPAPTMSSTPSPIETAVPTPQPAEEVAPETPSPLVEIGRGILNLPLGIRDGVGGFFYGLGTTIHNATGWGLEATPTPEAVASPVATPPPIEQPAAPVAPPAEEAQKVIASKVEQMQNTEEFKISLAANVGRELPIQDKIIGDILLKQGKTMADLSPEALESARKAVQTALENQVNLSADEALRSVIAANPDIDISSEQALDLAKQATKAQYEGWLADEALSQDKLVQAAQAALSEQVQAVPAAFTAKLTQFMAENQDNSELFTEHIVQRGETAGHLVLRMGEDVKWDGSDWQVFAALNQLNPDSFADLKTATGLASEQFEDLIKRIQNGDQEAYRELINKMGLIRAGSKVRLLTAEGMRRLLAFAKN